LKEREIISDGLIKGLSSCILKKAKELEEEKKEKLCKADLLKITLHVLNKAKRIMKRNEFIIALYQAVEGEYK